MEMKWECTSATIKNPWCTVANIMGNPNNTITRQLKEEDAVWYTTGAWTTYISTNTLKLGGINFIFKGKATWAQEAANQTSSAIGIIGWAGTFFGTIIVDIIALLFIWMAFMAAKWVSKIVNAAAKPFEDMGNSIWKLGASLPKYMPLPVPGVKGGMSLAGLQKTVELWSDKMKYGLEQKTLDEVGKLNPELVKGILKPKDVEELRNSINNIKSRPSKEFLEWSSKAIAQAQSKSEFRNANYETLAQEIKQNRKSNEEIGSFLTSKGISDSHERELLTKFLSWETNWMSEEHKKKAWELHQAKFWTWSSSTNNNTFNVKIAWTDKFTLEWSDFSITSGTSKEDILKLLNKNLPALAKISDDTLKNELKQLWMEEKELDDLIKNVKAERDKTKKDSSSPTTPPSSSGWSTNP